jgi:hypothetical protein
MASTGGSTEIQVGSVIPDGQEGLGRVGQRARETPGEPRT